MAQPTNFVESNALLALHEPDDLAEAEREAREMLADCYRGELITLKAACDNLSKLCAQMLREKRR